MLKNKKNNDYEKAVVAQKHQVDMSKNRLEELNETLEQLKVDNQCQSDTLDNLNIVMSNLFKDIGIDVSNLDSISTKQDNLLTDEELSNIDKRYENMFLPIREIQFESYEDYLKEVDLYMKEANIDVSKDPINQLFTEKQLKDLSIQYKETYGRLDWNKFDYVIIGISSVVGILLDFFIVRTPPTRIKNGSIYNYSTVVEFKDKEYKGSNITKFIQDKTTNIYVGNGNSKIELWLQSGVKYLEDYAKVPYDISKNNKNNGIDIKGLCPQYHRIMSLGHDPIMGFVFGVLDILRGSMTVVDKNGLLQILDTGDVSYNIFDAFVRVFAHFLSDICTPMGIEPPFMSLLQLMTNKTPFILNKDGEKITVNNVIRYMYKHGYDMRHMLTMGIVPFTIELIIRTYYNLTYYDTLINHSKDVRHIYKKNGMLTIAHSTAMSGDIIKMWMYGWNPTSFNYSEFLVLTKSIISFCKSKKEYNKWLEKEFINTWNNLAKYKTR